MTTLNKKVAIVTGSAKGIGFEIVKKLCYEFDGDVYLTGLPNLTLLNHFT